MTDSTRTASERAWAAIEEEKRRDASIRRIGKIAWGVTLLVIVIYAFITGASVWQFLRLMNVGAMSWPAVLAAITPFVQIVLALCVLVATLSTIAVFLRLRTASLSEIQVRLAALEEMLAAQGGSLGPRP
jgi:hypothetical protein